MKSLNAHSQHAHSHGSINFHNHAGMSLTHFAAKQTSKCYEMYVNHLSAYCKVKRGRGSQKWWKQWNDQRWKFFLLCFCSPPPYTNSFNKLLLQKEELEQKHVHLLQVVESEKTAKWQYTQQCEELASEIRKLRAEVNWII